MGLLSRLFSASEKTSTVPGANAAVKAETEKHLALAMSQRSAMTITFADPELAGVMLAGPCRSVESNIMLVEARVQEEGLEFQGKEVSVSFRLEHGENSSFHRFSSKICGLRQGGLLLEAPVELLSNQRRQFVRIKPPPDAVPLLEAWLVEANDKPAVEAFLPESPKDGQRSGKEGISLVNISASGLRLRIPGSPGSPLLACEIDSRVMCFLRLKAAKGDPAPNPAERSGTVDIVLDCQVKNQQEQMEPLCVFLGVNVNAWALPDQEKPPTPWSGTGENGQAPPLAAWVWRQQFQIARRM